MTTESDSIAETIVALERESLECWNKGDIDGTVEHYAEDVTYFDPATPESICEGIHNVDAVGWPRFMFGLSIEKSVCPSTRSAG